MTRPALTNCNSADLITTSFQVPGVSFRVFGREAPTSLIQIPQPQLPMFVGADWVSSQSTYMHLVVLSTYSRLGREIEFTEENHEAWCQLG
jgi:hypothetical protein